MNRRMLINLGLLGAIVVLLLISTTTDDEPVIETIRLSDIEPGSISSINVVRKNKPTLDFIKKENGWYMQAPLQLRANQARINAMLRLLNTESYAQLDPTSLDLARFELADPEVILQLGEHEFRFGTTDAIDQRRYVLFNDQLHMVNDFLFAQLVTNPGFFSDTRLVPEGKTITSIAFPENTFELVDGNWQMKTLMDIKPDQIKRLAYSWQNAVAISVSSYQEPAEEFPVVITTSDEQKLRFTIIRVDPHLVLGRKDLGIQYHLGSDEGKRLLLQENNDSVSADVSPG